MSAAATGDGNARRYNSMCELVLARVTATIHENADHTIYVQIENEHGLFGFTMTYCEAEDLVAHIGAAASSAEFHERKAKAAASVVRVSDA